MALRIPTDYPGSSLNRCKLRRSRSRLYESQNTASARHPPPPHNHAVQALLYSFRNYILLAGMCRRWSKSRFRVHQGERDPSLNPVLSRLLGLNSKGRGFPPLDSIDGLPEEQAHILQAQFTDLVKRHGRPQLLRDEKCKDFNETDWRHRNSFCIFADWLTGVWRGLLTTLREILANKVSAARYLAPEKHCRVSWGGRAVRHLP